MFERLKEFGEALKSYKDEPEEEEKTSTEQLLEFQKAKKEFEPTEEQKSVMTIEDYPGQTKTGEEILVEQSKQEKKEDQLDKKIKDIQKVLDTFGEKAEDVTTIKPEVIIDDPVKSSTLNLKALDLGNLAQKEYLQGLLPTSSSQTNRVDILLKQLKNLGL